MDAKKELDHVKKCSENCHNDVRESFFLGMICGLQKTCFHNNNKCWVICDGEKRLFSEVLEELKKEHGYQVIEVKK